MATTSDTDKLRESKGKMIVVEPEMTPVIYLEPAHCNKTIEINREPLFKPIWMSKMVITSNSSLNSKKHIESRVLAANKQNTTLISLPTMNFQRDSMSERSSYRVYWTYTSR
nr:hypothetical protein [Tanacetum cinerariifolium]